MTDKLNAARLNENWMTRIENWMTRIENCVDNKAIEKAQAEVQKLRDKYPTGTRIEVLGIPMLIVEVYSLHSLSECEVKVIYNYEGKILNAKFPVGVLQK